MKKIILVLVVLTISNSFQVQLQQEDPTITQVTQAKIPSFIGLGYNLLIGNPFTNRIDQGFKNPIFDFTFDKGRTTQDGKYLIPDYTSSIQSTSCNIQSRVSQFTGTQNYQKQLSTITKFDSRLSLGFLQAAFSFSTAFEQFSNSTQSHKETSSQSNAQCTVYTIQMPFYSNQIALSLDFTQGVKAAYAQNSWSYFINHFGTHYATSVTYGGRYFLQHTYSQQSMSLFQSMKLDINIAAKIQYLNKVEIALSQDLKRYVNQTNIINSHVQTTRLSTIGGEPPKSGNWIDWANTVKDNLAPVSYQLVTLSVLFNFIHNFDAAGAIKSFQSYLNSYCQRVRCPPLTPERPKPKPLVITFSKSAQLRGQSVATKTYDTNDGNIKVAMRVFKILMGSQGSIDSVQFFLTDGLTQHALPSVGSSKSFNHIYQVPKQDEIKCIRFGITYNNPFWKFTSMQFVTKKGVESEVFKGTYNVNEYRVLCLQDDSEHFVGYFGHYGNTFDSIGLNIMRETMQN